MSGDGIVVTTHEPADIEAAIVSLAYCKPLWDVGGARWAGYIEELRRFSRRWSAAANASGWSLVGLYGLHPTRPLARLSCMGAAWIVALCGYHVLGVDHTAIELRTVAGSRLRMPRLKPDPAAVLAWSLGRGARKPRERPNVNRHAAKRSNLT